MVRKDVAFACAICFFCLAVSGCAGETDPVIGWERAESSAKGTVIREIAPVVDGKIDITLHIYPLPEDTYYLIHEEVPSVFSVIRGEPDEDNTIRIISIKDSGPSRFIYTLDVSGSISGSYVIEGRFAMDSTGGVSEISGDALIEVS